MIWNDHLPKSNPQEFPPSDALEGHTSPKIQWRFLLFAMLIVYLMSYVNRATVVSQISSATSVALSQLSQFSQQFAEAASTSKNQPSADAKSQGGYSQYNLIEIDCDHHFAMCPDANGESVRLSSETVPLPRCR